MNLQLKYFGQIAEITEKKEEIINIDEGMEMSELCAQLESKYQSLKDINYTTAVNQLVDTKNINFSENDEVAFLPPFAGG